MGRKTLIDWADASWNPVTGCLHGCPYCYARGISQRFGCKIMSDLNESTTGMIILEEPYVCADGVKNPYPYEFLPTFHVYRLGIPKTWKQPKNIFVCSMADLFGNWVKDEYIKQVFDACQEAPQHRYLFLTKNPKRYIELAQKGMLINNDRFWYGYSATNNDDIWHFTHADDCPCQNLFVSIEPILKPVNSGFCSHVPADWVIIGAETGNRKGKVAPDKDWIMEIAEECELMDIPLFMKESLRGIMGKDFRQEFPWK